MLEQAPNHCPSCRSETQHFVHKTDLHARTDWVQCLRCGTKHPPAMMMGAPRG